MAIELEVKLKDGVTVPAGSAAHQVEVLTGQLKSLTTAIIKANAAGDVKAYQRLTERFQRMKEEAEKLKAAMPKPTMFERAGSALKRMGSELDAVSKEITGFSFASLSMVGAVALIATATAGAAVAFAKLSKAAYDAGASQNTLLARLDAMSGRAKGGEQIVGIMRKIAQVTQLTAAELEPFAETMMRAGVTDAPRLTQGLKAVAASGAMVKGGSEAMATFVGDINKAAESITGMSDLTSRLDALGLRVQDVGKAAGLGNRPVRELGAELNRIASTPAGLQKLGAVIQDVAIRKGAPSIRALAMEFSNITKKIGDGVAQLASRVGQTEGFKAFANQLQNFAMLFGVVSNNGKSAESGIVNAFDAIFRVGARVMKAITIAILDFQIAINSLQIAYKQFQKDWNMTTESIDSSIPSWRTLETILKGLAAMVVVVVASIGFMAALIMGPFIAVVAGLAWLAGKCVEMGERIIGGIIEGINKGKSALKATWNAVVNELPKALANKLEIKSPSRVMMRLGLALPQGLEQGIDKGTPEAVGATARMAMGVAGGGAVGVSAVAPSGRGGGVVVNLAPGSIQVTGASGESETSLVEEAIVSMFERIALTQGMVS